MSRLAHDFTVDQVLFFCHILRIELCSILFSFYFSSIGSLFCSSTYWQEGHIEFNLGWSIYLLFFSIPPLCCPLLSILINVLTVLCMLWSPCFEYDDHKQDTKKWGDRLCLSTHFVWRENSQFLLAMWSRTMISWIDSFFLFFFSVAWGNNQSKFWCVYIVFFYRLHVLWS